MSPPAATDAFTLDDFADLLGRLADLGVEAVVIGGCAVGAYARLLGEAVLSADLDLLVTPRALEAVVSSAADVGLRVLKTPRPRAVPVAVLDFQGKEVNLLTATRRLQPPDIEARLAREFRLGTRPALSVLVVDPFELLRDKLAMNRPKDRPHIEVLRRFLDEEIVRAFESEDDPRERIAPAERLLDVLDERTLAPSLARRLLPLARRRADYHFLAHRVPSAEMLGELLARCEDPMIRPEVEAIAAKRRLGGGPRNRR